MAMLLPVYPYSGLKSMKVNSKSKYHKCIKESSKASNWLR